MSLRSHTSKCLLLVALLALQATGLATLGVAATAIDPELHPLSPPDTSTPQATLRTFLAEATGAIDAYKAGDLETMNARADRVFQTFAAPYPASDADFLRGFEAVLQLLEILIRIDLPSADDAAYTSAWTEGSPGPWTIPYTEIRIVPVETPDGGPISYRFSKESLARVPEFHERVRELPINAPFGDYGSVFERFRQRPGFAAPGFFVSYVESLPPIWFESFGGEPLWKWTTLAIAVLAAMAAVAGLLRIAPAARDPGQEASGSEALLRPLLVIVAIVVFGLLRYVAVDLIRLTGTQRDVVVGVLAVLAHLAAIWLTFMVAARVAASVIRIRDIGTYGLDAQLIRLVSKLVAVLLALYVVVNLAETLGVPVAPVLASLGVGGLAVALAVRPTIENIFASFVLFADAPVRVGEFCKFGDKMGTVEVIGLRSVRVRALDRTIITIPNAEFCQLQIVNFSRRDAILLHTRLQLRYETTPDQLRLVLTKLRELLIKHPRVSPDPARVRFVGYGESSLDLEVFAFVETRDFGEFLAIQEDLNLRIKDVVEAAGSGFAFPSRTLYVERSRGLDADLTRAAETEVDRMRSENRLPFPEFDERTRRELSNTLDYPPVGSQQRT